MIFGFRREIRMFVKKLNLKRIITPAKWQNIQFIENKIINYKGMKNIQKKYFWYKKSQLLCNHIYWLSWLSEIPFNNLSLNFNKTGG